MSKISNMTDKTEHEALRETLAVAKNHSADNLHGAFMAVPEGFNIKSLEEFQDQPNRITATPEFRDTASLAHYLNRFETPGRILFSCPAKASICAVIDYHEGSTPSHCAHNATFKAAQRPWEVDEPERRWGISGRKCA